MSVAEIDVETIRCILGVDTWDFCTRLKKLKKEIERLEVEIEKIWAKIAP
ncbi:MAG: hypothetical protein QXK71_03275 [Pyrobaculum sp.]